jgi:hypothetical protein
MELHDARQDRGAFMFHYSTSILFPGASGGQEMHCMA